ncbi:MAG: hypothetical protein Q8O19_00155, partial [Rectinemataceae bacterium]|nr:hypothetical protein [Rectinemataceae bacterium]
MAEDSVADTWDDLLCGASDANPFQSFVWGEYKRLSGWMPSRYVARSNGGFPVGLMQVLVKQYFSGPRIIWIPGGLALNSSQSAISSMRLKLLAGLIEKLRNDFGICYIRFNFCTPNDPSFSFDLGRFFRRPIIKLTGGYSIIVDLNKNETEVVQGFSPKHRYYVKKALSHGVSWMNGNNSDLALHMATLMREMALKKNINAICASYEEIAGLCRLGGKNVLIL